MSTAVPTASAHVTESQLSGRSLGRSRWRARWWLAGGLIVVGAALAAAGWALGLPAGLFTVSDEFDSVYVVEPTTLNVTLKEDGELSAVNSIDLKCEVQGQGGLTIEWIVEESTHVKSGDLLVKLASDDFQERVEMAQMELQNTRAALETAEQELEITRSENESRVDKAEIDLEVAKLELRRYLEGDLINSVRTIELDIKRTQMQIDKLEDDLEKNRRLLEREFVTPAKIRELEDELERAQMTLEKYNLDMTILQNYEKPKNEMQKTAAVKQAQDELTREQQRAESRERSALAKVEDHKTTLAMRERRLERLRDALAKCEIRAPLDGVVQYGTSGNHWRSSRIAAGEQVSPGQTLITIPDTSQMMVKTRIHEADRHMVREGLPCIVRVPAVPGRVFSGALSKISQFADSESSWLNPDLKEHAAAIVLADTDGDVSPGDSAHVEILIEQVPDVLAVPVQSVFSRGAKRFVFVRTQGDVQPVEVRLGRATTTMVEVVDGVRTSDRVLMHVEERHLAMLPAAGPTAPMEPAVAAATGDSPPPGAPASPQPAADANATATAASGTPDTTSQTVESHAATPAPEAAATSDDAAAAPAAKAPDAAQAVHTQTPPATSG